MNFLIPDDNKLTDNEITKAVEYCIEQGLTSECFDCVYKGKQTDCITLLLKDALDLINRLQAENENLLKELDELAYKLGCLLCHATGGKLSKHTYPLRVMESYVNDTIQDYCEEAEAEAKAEAYKEFAERLKENLLEQSIVYTKIDNLLNELVGENK